MCRCSTTISARAKLAQLAAIILVLFLLLSLCVPSTQAADLGGCRSVHFWWHPSPAASAFYNEVKVNRSSNGSYFCVCGFNHGYFGIQQGKDGNKIVIFSVWDPSNPQDLTARASDVPVNKHVQVTYCDTAVVTKRFGGEGTGQQSFYQFPWEIGKSYKFLVTARPDKDRTAYAGYVFDPRINRWKHLATFSTLANGDLIKGPYSFDEDFKRDAQSIQEERSAYFSNGWLQIGTQWQPITSAGFSATQNSQTNIDAWSDNNGFGLATGGPTQNRHARVGEKLTAASSMGNPPHIDNLN